MLFTISPAIITNCIIKNEEEQLVEIDLTKVKIMQCKIYGKGNLLICICDQINFKVTLFGLDIWIENINIHKNYELFINKFYNIFGFI